MYVYTYILLLFNADSTSTSKFFFKRRRSQLAPGHQPATRLLVFTLVLVGRLLGAGDIAQCQ